MRHNRFSLFYPLLALALAAAPSFAVDTFFDNEGVDTDWSTAANWGVDGNTAADTLPTTGDNTYIGNGDTVAITLAGAEARALRVGHEGVTLAGNATLNMNTTTASLDALRLILGAGGTTAATGTMNLLQGTVNLNVTDGSEAVYLGFGNLAHGTLIMGTNGGTDADTILNYTGGRFEVAQAAGSTGTFTLHSGIVTGNENFIITQGGGAGTVNIHGGSFTTSTDMNFNNGNGVLNLTGGALNVRHINQASLVTASSDMFISGGTLALSGNLVTRSGSSSINLSGTGRLEIAGASNTRATGDYSQAGTSVLRLEANDVNTLVSTPLRVEGSATFADTPTVELDEQLPGTHTTAKEVSWTGGSAAWDATGARWSSGHIPAATPVVGTGETFDIITSPNAMTNHNLLSSGTAGWAVLTPDLFTVQLQRTGADIGADSLARARIDAAGETISRATDLTINLTDGVADAAILNMDNGTLALSNNLILGGDSLGVVNHNGGTVTIGGDLKFGADAASPEGGTYLLNGGTLTVTGNIAEQAVAVNNAQLALNPGSTLNVGGSITVQRFAVGENQAGLTSYTIANDITTTGTFAVGGSGTAEGEVFHTAASPNLNANNLQVGISNSAKGTFNQLGGSITTVGETILGGGGTAEGTLIVADGTFTSGGSFQIGGNAQSDNNVHGTFILGTAGGATTPTFNVNAGNTELAEGGTGTMIMHSGTFNQNASNFVLAQGENATARLTMNGGTLTVANDLNFNRGDGQIDHNGGTIATDDLRLGATNGTFANQRAVYNYNGGQLTVGKHLTVGESTTGEFNHIAGNLNLSSGYLILGGTTGAASTVRNIANGTYTLGTMSSAGTLHVGVVNNLEIGRSNGATGVFNHVNGAVTLGSGGGVSNMVIAQFAGSSGTYNLDDSDGTLTLTRGSSNANLYFNAGTGTFNQNGGTVSIIGGGSLGLSNNNSGTATYNLNAGTLFISGGSVDYRNNGSSVINLNGGTLDVDGGNVNFGNRDSNGGDEFNFTAGTLRDVGRWFGDLEQEGGRLEIGGSIGQMSIEAGANAGMAGDFLLHSAGVLSIEIDGTAGAGVAGGHDLLEVTGAVNLNANAGPGGGQLEVLVDVIGSGLSVGNQFLIIENLGADAVLNEFSTGLTVTGSDGSIWGVDYTGGSGNDVVLTLNQVIPEPGSLALVLLGSALLMRFRRS